MPITLNHSNIGVQYSTGSNYIIETVKSDLYRRNEIVDTITRDNIQTAPVTPIISIQDGSNVYAVESYTYSGSANTADFTRVFTKSTTCDILIVGGGGGGGTDCGGGGGGGGVIYAKNVSISANTYTIKVGKGGAGMANGISSEAFGATANGGGSGGGGQRVSTTLSNSGGSGGGGGLHNFLSTRNGGAAGTNTIGSTLSLGNVNNYNGNVGGTCPGRLNGEGYGLAGGGGGAGSVGIEGINSTTTGLSNIFNNGKGKGGDGVPINITGQTYYWAAGGGGGTVHPILPGAGGRGGGGGGAQGFDSVDNPVEIYGGAGGLDGIQSAIAPTNTSVAEAGFGGYGAPNTGSGGGGGGYYYNKTGGSGGSGIVIIRYLLGTIPTNNLLTTEPTVSFPTFTESIRTFTHSGGAETQTTHTITVGHNTICDILIVGGGGGGDREIGGGGGGGAVLYATNITIQAGTYQIKVGKGGAQNVNGSSSEAFGATCLGGGSTVYQGWSTGNGGTSGGSGSGGSANAPITAINNINGGGIGTSTKGTLLASGTLYNGNVGGNGSSSNNYHAGGGGGGAGTAGNNPNGNQITTRQSYINSGYPQKGGDGVPINITGTTYYWGAGGGGGSYDTHGGDGGLGGGGGGGASIQLAGLAGTGGINNGGNGVGQRTGAAPYEVGGFGAPNTGSGGGGGGYFGTASGGAGGSGIVIIKFKTIVSAGILDNTTHKRLDFAFDSLGFYFDATKSVEYQAQQKTGVGGWRIVRYLPPNLGRWYQGDYINTSTFNIPTIGTPYNYTNEWAVSFGTFDEMFFATFDMTYWLQCLKTSVLGSYSNGARPIIKSSFSSTPYTALWYNRATGAPEDPWIRIVQEDNSTVLYGENNNTDLSSLRNAYGGMCVLVRDSTSGTTISNPNQYTLNFPVPTLADINNNSNIVLRGAYDIALSTSNALIIPKTGQYIPKPTTFVSDLLSIRYNILNPLNDPTGAQWAYNTSNMNVCRFGSVGIGTTNPEYTLDVSGSVNAKSYYLNGRQINEPLSELGLSEGMIAQVRHLTYTQMDIKNNTGWDAINDNLTTGFVIAITPKSNLSKILLNIIVHIGLAATNYSVWWGIKLYRKIGSSDWTEVTGPNGTETGSAAATAGTPVWISNTMYAGDQDYIYKVTNVTGTYLDSPNTTSTVYYTAYWNNRLGDNPSAINTIYLNRAESHGDAWRPAPSSSWTASEIWYG
jgi:hypothetical protein